MLPLLPKVGLGPLLALSRTFGADFRKVFYSDSHIDYMYFIYITLSRMRLQRAIEKVE